MTGFAPAFRVARDMRRVAELVYVDIIALPSIDAVAAELMCIVPSWTAKQVIVDYPAHYRAIIDHNFGSFL